MTTTTASRDNGKGLDKKRVGTTPQGYSHYQVEGYDVIVGSAWEGDHTSRWADIEKDGETVEQVRLLSDAYAWIREQTGKQNA